MTVQRLALEEALLVGGGEEYVLVVVVVVQGLHRRLVPVEKATQLEATVGRDADHQEAQCVNAIWNGTRES